MAQLYGVDISEWQGAPDWDTLNANSNFVIMRTTVGGARADNQLARNRSEAYRVQASAGPLGIGFYHYAYPQYNTPQVEADLFCDVLGQLHVGDMVFLDWEEPYGGDHAAWALAWLQHVEARLGVKGLIYLNQSLMNSHNWQPLIANGYGLWLAQYDGNQQGTGVNTPWNGKAVRQWTSSGHVPGLSGNIDCNTFYGDFATWAHLGYKLAEPAPTPQPPVPEPPVTTTTTTVAPVTTTTTTEVPVTTTTTTLPEVTTTTTTAAEPIKPAWWTVILLLIVAIIKRLQGEK